MIYEYWGIMRVKHSIKVQRLNQMQFTHTHIFVSLCVCVASNKLIAHRQGGNQIRQNLLSPPLSDTKKINDRPTSVCSNRTRDLHRIGSVREECRGMEEERGKGLQLGPFEICKAYKLCAWSGRQTANESKDNPIYFTLCPIADAATKCGSCSSSNLQFDFKGARLHAALWGNQCVFVLNIIYLPCRQD